MRPVPGDHAAMRRESTAAPMQLWTRAIETTIVPDKKGGFGTLPALLTVLCGGFPRNFVSDLESAHLSGRTHFRGS